MTADSNGYLVEFTESLVRPLLDEPELLSVTAADTEDYDTVCIEITVAPDDVGKVIGRRGRIIKSLRTLVRAAASRDGLNAEVEVLG